MEIAALRGLWEYQSLEEDWRKWIVQLSLAVREAAQLESGALRGQRGIAAGEILHRLTAPMCGTSAKLSTATKYTPTFVVDLTGFN